MLIEKLKNATLFVSVFFLSLGVSQAQQQETDFGNFTADEIELKQCPFDKDADAIVLLDKATANYNEYHYLITERRIRFKILKERGIHRGDIHIRYYNDDNFETISGIDAVVLNADTKNNGGIIKLDKKLIFTKKLNKYYSEISFALPNIKAGSIIEYKYESEMKNYSGLRDWIFQKDMPVLFSSFYLTILPNAEFAYTVYKATDMPINIKRETQSGSVLFEMANIPGLREEAYMGAARDYLQRVKFQFSGFTESEMGGFTTTKHYTTTWKDLSKELLESSAFGTQLNKTLPAAEILQPAMAMDEFSKMKLIHNFVKSRFSWNDVYSKYAEDGLKTAWEKKTGTSAELNLILINLLKSAGLSVQPLLVSERSFGKVDTVYPFIDQFDKVVAYVTINGKSFILDGTDRETPTSVIPYDLLNTMAFIIDKKKPVLIKIMDDSKANQNTENIIGVINNKGSMEMQAEINNYDYAKLEKKEKYDHNKKLYEKEFFEPYQATTLDTLSIDGLESDSLPIHHTVKVNNYTLNRTGDYLLLNYNLFTGITKNPFISEKRFSDINFGCKYLNNLTATFNLPKELTPEALPKSVRLITADKSMSASRLIQQTNDVIQVAIKININKTEYTADDYEDVKAFYKQMIDLLNEPIVLKVKS